MAIDQIKMLTRNHAVAGPIANCQVNEELHNKNRFEWKLLLFCTVANLVSISVHGFVLGTIAIALTDLSNTLRKARQCPGNGFENVSAFRVDKYRIR